MKPRIFGYNDLWGKINNKKKYLTQVEIHPTNRCQLDCKWCFYKKRSRNIEMGKMIFFQLIEDILQLSNGKTKVIFSGGGEPTLYPYLLEGVKFCKKNKLKIGIISNGLFPNSFARKIGRLLENGDFIRISLDASDGNQYFRLKGIDAFDKIIKMIDLLCRLKNKDKNFELNIGYAVSRKNLIDILQFYDFIINLLNEKPQINNVILRPIIDGFLTDRNNSLIESQIKEMNKIICPLDERINISDFLNRLKGINAKISFKRCYVREYMAVVEPNGEVYPCAVVSAMSQKMSKHKYILLLGNITYDRFKDIWLDKEKYLSQFCPRCNPRDILFNNYIELGDKIKCK